MQPIDDLVRTATTATPAQPTKAEAPSITLPLAAKLLDEFQNLGDWKLEGLKQEALTFCSDIFYRRKPHWLSILGTSGAGKTMLARIVFRWVKDVGCYYTIKGATGEPVVQAHNVLWVNWRTAAAEMKQGDFSAIKELCLPASERDHQIWLAVLDDIGAGDETSKAYLTNALDQVCNARLNRWTLFTSNLSLGGIAEQIDVRISSRMARDGNISRFVDVPDFSLRSKKPNP